jgi:Skp family chaperone for outer membrane proteins
MLSAILENQRLAPAFLAANCIFYVDFDGNLLTISTILMRGLSKTVICAAAAISLVGIGSGLSAAPAQKIFSIDVQKVMDNYEVAKASLAAFSADEASASKDLKEMYDAMMKLQEEISELNEKAENTSLVDSAREKFKNEANEKGEVLRVKNTEFLQFRRDIATKLGERRQKELEDQIKSTEIVTAEIAKARKADAVINKACTMYVDDSLDITQLVVDKLNANVKK